jgi:hypothetical protein
MGRWNDKELGHLRYIMERDRGSSVWEMAQQAHKKIKNRTVNAISHQLRKLSTEEAFEVGSVEFNGEVFPAEIVSGYVIISLKDGTKTPFHHYVWRQHHLSPIPTGYHIHHRDGDRLNNNPNNLALIDAKEHLLYHHKATFPETFALFSFLQEQHLWDVYLTYRDELIQKLRGSENELI